MSRFASLSSPSSRVRGQLQARLYYAREKNREAQKTSKINLVPSGDWSAASDATLSEQTNTAFRLQTGAGDFFGGGYKSFDGFVLGESYVFEAVAPGTGATMVVVTVENLVTSSDPDVGLLTAAPGFNRLGFTAPATTLYFCYRQFDAAGEMDTFVSGLAIRRVS